MMSWYTYLYVSAGKCWRKICALTAVRPSTLRPRWSWTRWRSTAMPHALRWSNKLSLCLGKTIDRIDNIVISSKEEVSYLGCVLDKRVKRMASKMITKVSQRTRFYDWISTLVMQCSSWPAKNKLIEIKPGKPEALVVPGMIPGQASSVDVCPRARLWTPKCSLCAIEWLHAHC